MITSRGWWNFSSAAVLLVSSTAARADLTFSLTPPVVPAGERATLEIRLPEKDLMRPPGMDPEEAPNAHDDFLTNAPGVLVLDRDFRKIDETYVWRYEITGYKPGSLTLPPVEIRLGPQSFSTTSQRLEITTGRAEDDGSLRPDYGQVSMPWPWGKIFLALFALAGGTWAYRRWQRWAEAHRRQRASAPSGPPPEDAETWLRRRFAEARLRLEHGLAEQTIDDLSEILRGYFTRRRELPVNAWTTREFRERFHGDGRASLLVPIFERCDRFKFTPKAEFSPAAIASACLDESEHILLEKTPA